MKAEETVEYRGYTLVAKQQPRGAKCWAWKDGKAAYKLEGVDVSAAIQKARQAVDHGEGIAERDGDAGERAYARALQAILGDLSLGQIQMLQAHYRAPNRVMSASELAKAAGYTNFSAANLQYGNVGKALHAQHPVAVPQRRDGTLVYTCALADGLDEDISLMDGSSHWRWRMLPSLAFALRAVGLVSD